MKSSWRFFLSLGTAVALLGSLPAAALPLPQASPDSTKLRTDENVARQSFEDIWTPANRALPFSKGTVVSSCTPGEANPEAVKQMLAVWNYIRALNGLSQLEIPPEYEPSTFPRGDFAPGRNRHPRYRSAALPHRSLAPKLERQPRTSPGNAQPFPGPHRHRGGIDWNGGAIGYLDSAL